MLRVLVLLVLSFMLACARNASAPAAPATPPDGGTCLADHACDWKCPEGRCTYVCNAGSTCHVSCAGGGCKTECKPGATCTGDL